MAESHTPAAQPAQQAPANAPAAAAPGKTPPNKRVLGVVALIARGVSFEFYGKRDSARWRRAWDAATTGGSLLAPLLIGVALGNLLHGVPFGTDQEYAGTFTDLLNPYALFTGVTVVLLCLLHGASFLTLKTVGELRERTVQVGRRIAPVAAAAVLIMRLPFNLHRMRRFRRLSSQACRVRRRP